MSTLHRNASTHALTLGSGRTLAPGEDADIDTDHRVDSAFLEAGDLVEVEDSKPAKKAAAKKKAPAESDTDQEATS